MRIAILGTGFCGLAAGWFLLKNHTSSPLHLTFFDPQGIGGGASGVAAGLLHPFVGASAKLNKEGREGWSKTRTLLELATEKIGRAVAREEGHLRIAITERQKKDFRAAADQYEDIEWYEADEIHKKIPAVTSHPGIFIKNCMTVDCRLYLEGLWLACEEKGAWLEKRCVVSLSDVLDYDYIVLAMGSEVNKLLSSQPLPITGVKGQIVELEWSKTIPRLPCALSSQAYLIMNSDKNTCIAGATYERGFISSIPDPQGASLEILPKAAALIPELGKAQVLSCKAGVRASTPDHMPLVQQINPQCWAITGMGSKGLLYHALYAERLAMMILGHISSSS